MRESRTIIATIMIGVLIVGLCACTGMPDGDKTNEQTTEVESTEWCLVDTPKGYERQEHGKEISFHNDQGSQIWIHIIEKKGYSDAWYYMKSDTSRTLDHAEKRGNYMWLISKYWSREEDGSTKPWVYAYTDVSDNYIIDITFSKLNMDSAEVDTVLSSFKNIDEEDLEGIDISRNESNARDFTPSISLDERKGVNSENFFRDPTANEKYFFNKVFDFSAYEESLGYTRLVSPEDENDVMYAITRDGVNYFLHEGDDEMPSSILVDCKDGFLYVMDIIERLPRKKPYYNVISRGNSAEVGEEQLNKKIEVVKYIATADNVVLNEIPEVEYIYKLDSVPQYYKNGLIEYNFFRMGDIVETINGVAK